MDHSGTTITLHADGKVVIEGTQGVTIDSANSNMELKGNQIAIKARRGQSKVEVPRRESRQRAQPDRCHHEARRQWYHRRERGFDVPDPSSMVKIN